MLTAKQREALELLADDQPHRTVGRRPTGPYGHVNANMAVGLERLGLVRYVRCEHCRRGDGEVQITPRGHAARAGELD